MRKPLISIIYCLIFTSVISAQTASEKFNAGMKAYNSSQFVEANRLFDSFLKEQTSYDEVYATATFYSSMSLLKMGNSDAAAVGLDYMVRNFIWSNFRDHALYELGIIYFDHKNYSLSRGYLIKLLDDFPECEYSGSALYWVGESYTRENKLEDAINFLLQAIQDKKKNKYIDYTIYSLASIYEKMGDYENAEKYYDELISFHSESPLIPQARIRIGMCYFKLKDYQSSILELNNPSLSVLPNEMYSECLYYLANSYYRAQEYANAEKTYKEILQSFPGVPITNEVKYGLAWSLFQQKKYNDAFKVFNVVSEGTDTLAIKSFYWKGESKRYAGQESDAMDIYMDFIVKHPDNKLAPGVEFQLGVLYYNAANFSLSQKYLESALKSFDNTVRSKAYTMLGEIFIQEKHYEAARINFDYALNVPDVAVDLQNRSLLGLGIAYYYLNKFIEAIASLSEIDIRDPNFEKDKLNFYLAENLYASGNYEQAIARYNNVSTINQSFSNQALFGRAYALFNLKQYEHASDIFSEFVKRYPDDSKIIDAKLRLADCYFGSKSYSSAASVYKDLMKTDKSALENPFTYFQYAQALFRGGKNTDAINEFRTLQLKYPASEYADKSLYLIGWITFQQSNYKGAISAYLDVITLYPATSLKPLIYYSVGDCYYNLSNYDSSIANYQRVLNEYPSSSYVFDAINGIQYSYVAKGEQEKAVVLINDFVNRNPKSGFADKLFFRKGELYYSQKQYDLAKKSYIEFTNQFPDSKLVPDAWYWMGKSCENTGLYDEALLNFGKVFNNYPSNESAAGAVIEMGTIYNDQKKYDLAINLFTKATDRLAKSSRLPEILFMKATTLANKGDINSAFDIFANLVQNYTSSIFADKSKMELALVELAAKRYDNAETYFKSLSDTRTDELGAKAQYYLGVLNYELGKLPEAATAFVRVKTVFAGYDEWLTRAYLKLGDVYVDMKDEANAKDMYKYVLSKHKSDAYGHEAQTKLRALK